MTYIDLRARFSATYDPRLDGFSQAIEDHAFRAALMAETVYDIRLGGDDGPAISPSAETLLFDGGGFAPAAIERVDLVVAAGLLHRIEDPFRFLAAIHPLLKTNGALILSVPLRDHGPARHRRSYTVSSLFLELQAAWGFNTFRIRFAREYDGQWVGSAPVGQSPHSLIIVVEKSGERQFHPDPPQLVLDRPGAVYNRSQDEDLLAIDLGTILSPGLDPATFKRICVLKLDHIGDFVMGVPVFDDIRQLFPDAHVTGVCGSWNATLARDLGCFDEVVTCDYYSSGADGPHGAEAMAAAAQELERRFDGVRFDLAIDLRVPPDSRAIIQVIDARYRAAIGSAEQFPYLDVALPALDSFSVGIRHVPEAALVHVPAEAFAYRGMGAASPPGLRILHARAEGHMVWGPYAPLGRGCYRVTWMLTTPERTVPVTVDVAIHDPVRDSVTVLAEAVVDVGPDGTSGTLDVELHADLDRVEFRVRADGDAAGEVFLFTGVRLETISGRPTIRNLSPAQVHMKEHMALLVALVRTRLLAPIRGPEAIRTALRATAPTETETERFFVIVPFSNSLLRNWQMGAFQALCRSLLAETGARIRLVGSPAQRPALDGVIAEIGSPRVENHAGAPWGDVYAGFAHAEAVIANNSGMAHVAALLGARVLAIYSGSHQVIEWGPIGPQVSVLQASLPCGACGFDTTTECLHGLRCMQVVSPPAVVRTLRTIAPASFHPPRTHVPPVAPPPARRWTTLLRTLLRTLFRRD